MEMLKQLIEFLFGAGLFINALLFVPQIIRIIKERSALGVSIVTFSGFLLIQFAVVLHGLIYRDYLLAGGYLLSMLTCGTVVFLVLFFKNKKEKINFNLSDVIEQLPGHIYWKDRAGTLLGCNTNNWRDFGLQSLKEFVGKTDYDLFSKHDADAIRANDTEVMRENKMIVFEETYNSPQNEKISYLSHKMPLKDSHNETIGILGLSVDITHAKRESKDKFDMLENIIAVMPGHVYWVNKEGYYLGCNDNQARAIGLTSRKDIVGKRNQDLPGFSIPEALDPVNKQVLETGISITLEEPATLPDGTQGTYISSKVPIFNDRKEVIGMVGISIDITDRKKQEQELVKAKIKAEEANRAKSDFISNMEHDIRTPFTGIYSLVDCLAMQEADPVKKDLLQQIALCGKELLDYCDSILQFSTIEAGVKPIIDKSFGLPQLLESVVAMESAAAIAKNLAFNLTIAPDVPKVVIGDDYRLKRILLNLLSNAIKFTQQGSIEIAVSRDKTKLPGRQVLIKFSVEDTGIGIPHDKQQHIYERFSKAMPSNKGIYKGLGLGLTVVKQFVEELQGEIHLESEEGKGSKFVIYLPMQLPLSDEITE